MDRQRKAQLSLVCILVSIAVVDSRTPKRLVMVAALTGLLALAVRYRSRFAVAGFALSSLFIYTGTTIGWLYGRDSHSTIAVVEDILATGWEIKPMLAPTAVPETPALHILTGSIHLVTGLPVLPSTKGKPLLPAILPLILVSVTYLTTYAIIRTRCRHPAISGLAMLPVVLWFPIIEGRVAFRRQTLGLLLFTLSVLLSYRLLNDQGGKRDAGLLAFFGSLLVFSHQFTAVITLVFLVFVSIAGWINLRQWGPNSNNGTTLVPVIVGVVFAFWYFLSWSGGSLFLTVTIHSAQLLSGTSGGGVVSELGPDFIDIVRFDFSKWFYQVALALPLLASAVLGVRQHQLDRQQLVTIFFGGVIAVASLASYKLRILVFDRFLTLFVVAGGSLAIIAVARLVHHTRLPQKAIIALVLVFAVLGGATIPNYVLADTHPNYDDGGSDQQFSASDYSTLAFITEYGQFETVLIDGYERGPIQALGRIPTTQDAATVRSASVPRGGAAVLFDLNRHLFVAATNESYFKIRSEGLWEQYSQSQHRVYDSGRSAIFTRARNH
ncbi:hypothetical protein [Halogeometricum borinquense]|uniref:hypothetical protein n=1 Tax=Halogeometricum borinquense TaxID=60847 RepID=UPI0034154BA7